MVSKQAKIVSQKNFNKKPIKNDQFDEFQYKNELDNPNNLPTNVMEQKEVKPKYSIKKPELNFRSESKVDIKQSIDSYLKKNLDEDEFKSIIKCELPATEENMDIRLSEYIGDEQKEDRVNDNAKEIPLANCTELNWNVSSTIKVTDAEFKVNNFNSAQPETQEESQEEQHSDEEDIKVKQSNGEEDDNEEENEEVRVQDAYEDAKTEDISGDNEKEEESKKESRAERLLKLEKEAANLKKVQEMAQCNCIERIGKEKYDKLHRLYAGQSQNENDAQEAEAVLDINNDQDVMYNIYRIISLEIDIASVESMIKDAKEKIRVESHHIST